MKSIMRVSDAHAIQELFHAASLVRNVMGDKANPELAKLGHTIMALEDVVRDSFEQNVALAAAKENYESDTCSIAEPAIVSVSEEGAWVQAWVWIGATHE